MNLQNQKNIIEKLITHASFREFCSLRGDKLIIHIGNIRSIINKNMLNKFKSIVIAISLIASGSHMYAQSSCCTSSNKLEANCETNQNQSTAQNACCAKTTEETTSGCTPSSCRGAQTKFGEAKVITDLRTKLVALKSKMETYKPHKFSNNAITMHGIVGESDEESLDIIYKHLMNMESEIYPSKKQKLPKKLQPKSKADRVKLLDQRITEASKLL